RSGVIELRVSRDERFLWARDTSSQETFTLQPLGPNGETQRQLVEGNASRADYDIGTFARIWHGWNKKPTHFMDRSEEKVTMIPNLVFYYGSIGGSAARREVFTEERGLISIWNMSDGRLKRRVRYSTWISKDAVFSPDGKWLLAAQTVGDSGPGGVYSRVRRYDVQSGKLMPSPDILNVLRTIAPLQFSPDGKYLLVGGRWGDPRALIFDTSQWKQLWSDQAVVSAGWSADNRVGLAKSDKFEWRDAVSGQVLQSLPGPAKGTGIWTASPDGQWIYANNDKQQILRWRAR
ncbi:MAG: WD40 repeat domain-containing protein, partial [Armatimonadetes bacterium]|nr:WD40 repeat domain-containing protein [Armatimonadota bacterium]